MSSWGSSENLQIILESLRTTDSHQMKWQSLRIDSYMKTEWDKIKHEYFKVTDDEYRK